MSESGSTTKAAGLLTVGHGRHDRTKLADLLHDGGVRRLVDVRRFPASRHNPDVEREALATWLPAAGIDYTWEERLGGRRRLDPDAPPLDTWWHVTAFRAYAAYTRTTPFTEAMAKLLETARSDTTAVMCSESVWWRCHRRLIADVALLIHHLPVQHLLPDGRIRDHQPSAGARILTSGQLIWDHHQEPTQQGE